MPTEDGCALWPRGTKSQAEGPTGRRDLGPQGPRAEEDAAFLPVLTLPFRGCEAAPGPC